MDTKDFSGLRTGGVLPEPTLVNTVEIIEDMWSMYLDTVTSLLGELEVAALELEAGQNAAENVAAIRRLLHSVKGDSGMAGLMDVHDLCHEAETSLEAIGDNGGRADMVLRVKDWIEAALGKAAAARGGQPVPAAPARRLRALVIDDDVVCRKRLEMLLKGFFDCAFANDGQEGLEVFMASHEEERLFDLITLDINMPRLDGHRALNAIRQFEEGRGIGGLDGVKVIMTTSEGASRHIFGAFREGCEAYVVKSHMGEKLLDEIAKLGLLKVVKVQKDYAVD